MRPSSPPDGRLLLLLLLTLVLLAGSARALDGSTLYQEKQKSVVVVLCYDAEGNRRGLGSGFYIDRHKVATNFHVIQRNIEITGDDWDDFEVHGRITVRILGTSEEIEVEEVLGFDSELDVAVLEVEQGANPLELGPGDRHAVGETVYVIGNPLGLEGTFSTGVISAKREYLEDQYLIQFTADIAPGSSGGPVFNDQGIVIGIATMGFIYFSGNYNFAVPVYGIEKRGENEEWWLPMEEDRLERERAAERARMDAARREAAERRRKLMEERRRLLEARALEQGGEDEDEDKEEEREVYLRYVVRILKTGGRIRARSVERMRKEDGTEAVRVVTAFGASSLFPADAVEIEDRGPRPEPPEPPEASGGSPDPEDADAEGEISEADPPADDADDPKDGDGGVVSSDAVEPEEPDEPEEAEAVEEPEPAFIVEMLSTGGRLEVLEVSRETAGDTVRIRIRTKRGMIMYVTPDQVRVYRPDGTTPVDPASLP